MAVNLSSIINRLEPRAKQTLEAAVNRACACGNSTVELSHWLLDLFKDEQVSEILDSYRVNQTTLFNDLNKTTHVSEGSRESMPGFSQEIVDCLEQAWNVASLDFGAEQISNLHVLIAVFTLDSLHAQVINLTNALNSISVSSLIHKISQLIHICEVENNKPEKTMAKHGKVNNALERFTIDLTELVKQGKVPTVLGRDDEINQLIDVLSRARKNNPILTGEPGVGKTAVVEGLAQRIASEDVPRHLIDTHINVLDIGLLQAGASVKGEFESRLKSVIDAVKQSENNIILFIDEAHMMIGGGGTEGQNDMANLLKPELARGELRTIAATTWSEYKKYFEKDPALTRRFQVVTVLEPCTEKAVEITRAVANGLALKHKVIVLDEAITAAVNYSIRYLPEGKLPDKSISLIDGTAAKVSMSNETVPYEIRSKRYTLKQVESEIAALANEVKLGFVHNDRLQELTVKTQALQRAIAVLETQYEREKELVQEILRLGQELVTSHESDENTSRIEAELSSAKITLAHVQGENPMLSVYVDASAIANMVTAMTGIPLGKVLHNEASELLGLDAALGRRVKGQDHAVAAITKSIQISRANLGDDAKPTGIFLLAGTSGTGKTETALALAEALYGSESNIITINMSEFKEQHKVSTLIGSPPGYVGYGSGGILTNAIRRKPYSVVLLDEIEKAHPSVHELFYQVFDKGVLVDSEGRSVSFKNTVIILTSNVGTKAITENHATVSNLDTELVDTLQDLIMPELSEVFAPAFLGRVSVIPYLPLSDGMITDIARIKLDGLKERVQLSYSAELNYSEAALQLLATRSVDFDIGARKISQIIEREILPELAIEFLKLTSGNTMISNVNIDVSAAGGFTYALTGEEAIEPNAELI